MKYIILVGDGMGDYPLPELENKTPLEAASTPAMDYLCRHGELFRTRTIPEGYAPGSDVANLSLLGYLPQECYSGRAPLEAASMGVKLTEDEIACRCNLVTLNHSGDNNVTMLDYSAGHISTDEARILVETLDRELRTDKVCFHPGISYRHLMVHKGDLKGLETVPPHDYIGRPVTEYWNRYLAIPHIKELLEKSSVLLEGHEINRRRIEKGLLPANAIWLWGEGKSPAMPTIKEQFGLTGALISAVDLLKGIGIYGGLQIINVPGATGYLDTNYEGKKEAALEALQEMDFVFVHVEAPDEAGHQGLINEKIQAIEDFDARIVKPILDGLHSNKLEPFRLVVAMDHYTPISTRTHASLPVPMILYDSRDTNAGCDMAFNEKNAESSKVLMENGQTFFNKLVQRNIE